MHALQSVGGVVQYCYCETILTTDTSISVYMVSQKLVFIMTCSQSVIKSYLELCLSDKYREKVSLLCACQSCFCDERIKYNKMSVQLIIKSRKCAPSKNTKFACCVLLNHATKWSWHVMFCCRERCTYSLSVQCTVSFQCPVSVCLQILNSFNISGMDEATLF